MKARRFQIRERIGLVTDNDERKVLIQVFGTNEQLTFGGG